MSTEPGPIATVQVGDFSVSSTAETAEALEANLNPSGEGDADASAEKTPGERVSEAAKELGRKGGEASAEKRKAQGKQGLQRDDDSSGSKDDDVSAVSPADRAESGGEDGTDTERPLGKPRNDPRARVEQATREAKEAREALQYERQERSRLVRELEQARAGKPTEAPKPSKGDDPEPQAEDYDNHATWTKDLAAWSARQENTKYARAQEERQAAQRYTHDVETVMELYVDRMKEAEKADPELKENVGPEVWGKMVPTWLLTPQDWQSMSGQDKAYSLAANELVRKSENPAGVLRYFTENPSEFQRIATLRTHEDIVRVMAKLEARLEREESAVTAGTSAPPPISKAPTPFRPVKGSPSAADSVPSEDAAYEEHRRYWNAKERQRK